MKQFKINYTNMEDFEDFYSEEENAMPSAEQLEHLDKLKDSLARANYEAIVQYGIDVDSTQKPEVIQRIIQETLIYFEELEEYEKCAKLKQTLEQF